MEQYYRYGQDPNDAAEVKSNYLVYKMLPGCLFNLSESSTKTPLCEDGDCRDSVFNYMKAVGGFQYDYTGLQLVGLALDGHAIYGPYNEDEELWTCEDHDVCNGRFFPELDNSYAYVATSTHPYILGCWGPGPNQEFP